MKKLFVILLCTALLAGVLTAPAYADDCIDGGCEDQTFIGRCVGWLDVVITGVADAFGIDVNITGTVGPLYQTDGQVHPEAKARVRATLDGEYTCTGSCGYGKVYNTGEEFENELISAGPYDLSAYVPADTSAPHTLEVLVAQDGCINCPRMDTVEVEPYVPPPVAPPERCGVTGAIWYQCNSGAWLYGTGILRDCPWCNGLNGNRVVKESYDCGKSWTWYYNGEHVEDPPQELGRYPCPTAGCYK
jgi:hypothetical protein